MNPSDITDIRTGRLATVRLGPNQDLVEGLQQAAAELGFERAACGAQEVLDDRHRDGRGGALGCRGDPIGVVGGDGDVARRSGGRLVGDQHPDADSDRQGDQHDGCTDLYQQGTALLRRSRVNDRLATLVGHRSLTSLSLVIWGEDRPHRRRHECADTAGYRSIAVSRVRKPA